jgi:hypothetical protein
VKLRLDLDNFDACPQYNDWIDDRYTEISGTLRILGFEPRPSLVLYSLSQDTYQAAFDDFQRQREEEIKQIVLEKFPSPVAHYFYRFENGYENELQRLHLLRDTWEALVDVLHTITVAECRFTKISLPVSIAFSHIFSDSVAQRLLNVERVLLHAHKEGISLGTSQIVSFATLATMRELNQIRNGFSHSAAQSESQATAWIGECYEDVIDVLDDVQGLANVEILRYLGQLDGKTLRCEVFKGHGFTRTIRTVPLNSGQIAVSQGYLEKGQILVYFNNNVTSGRPLIYYREDPSGQATKLCMFRRIHGRALDRRIEYEVVGEGARCGEDRILFKTDIDEIRSLFGLGPD